MQPIDKIIADTANHIRASVERVRRARDVSDIVVAALKKSEQAFRQSQTVIARVGSRRTDRAQADAEIVGLRFPRASAADDPHGGDPDR